MCVFRDGSFILRDEDVEKMIEGVVYHVSANKAQDTKDTKYGAWWVKELDAAGEVNCQLVEVVKHHGDNSKYKYHGSFLSTKDLTAAIQERYDYQKQLRTEISDLSPMSFKSLSTSKGSFERSEPPSDTSPWGSSEESKKFRLQIALARLRSDKNQNRR